MESDFTNFMIVDLLKMSKEMSSNNGTRVYINQPMTIIFRNVLVAVKR